ncbi:MAG: Crp/Fnr family transcriptional regulator [Comamonadaceae bacterium CG1_02_60_18]|nr:MAG: Crp/Fnr family transcriptional regulator [Comamonadaceae bacterium CG1_02_60_18]PIQ50504.1 MAG: Crp/Fnr family transcriptional regulator [Comamonadaceae bacterium CG12_big_fil_rev_8_21_14_0_65_59_15]
MQSEPFNIRSYLAQLPLFADLADAERERLALACETRRLARGDTVFRVGEPCLAFHVVVLGQVKLFVTNVDGQEKVIELVGPGYSFAEALMFLDKPYFLNAQTLADTLLINIRKDILFREIEHEPRLAMRMLAGLSRRLHGLVQDVESYTLHSGMQRLIGYLLREVQTGNDDPAPRVNLPVSKATLASRLSLTPEYFSRVLHELQAQGLIAVHRRDIDILDARRLAAYGAR